jgi:hypothetical protein
MRCSLLSPFVYRRESLLFIYFAVSNGNKCIYDGLGVRYCCEYGPTIQGLTAYRAITDWFEARPINQAMRRQVTECAHARLDTIGIDFNASGAEVKMLDYACGNGFYSRVNTSSCAPKEV